MDNFPLKRGIGISRTTHPQPQMPTFQMDLPTNTQRPLPKHFQPQMTVMSRQPQKAVDLKGQGPHSRTFSTGIQDPTQQPKIKPTDPVIKQQNFKFEPSVLVQTPQNNLPKLISFTNGPILMPLAAQEERALMNVQNMLTVNNSNRPQQPKNCFQQVLNNPSLSIKIDQKDLSKKEEESVQLGNSQKTLAIPSLTLVQHQVIPTVDNIKKSSRLSEDYINLLREKEKLNEQLRQTKQQSETWEIERQVLNDNLKEAKRQNGVLQAQRKQLQRKIEWIDHQNSSLITERQTLLMQGQSKLATIKQLQNRLFQQDIQSKSKISAIEHQLRLMKGNKNRLQIEIDSNKKLVKSEREKNEKTREQMNKLIFFQDDLIHAKDYNRLKDQVQYILAENARLVEEHQQYIVEVGLGRQAFNVQFKELDQQLLDLRIEYSNYRQKIENCLQAGEDKMTILKLQSQINFLRKKIEEQAELVSAKENELENAKEHIRELTAIQNDKKLQNNHFLDEISLWQIQDSVALYEQRVAALTRTVNKQQQDNNKQRKTIELLTAELRRIRQEKNITTLKQKSSENSLKSEVEILQKGHQTQIELKNKKISNLEEGLLRKAKEIGEKDKFIKEFLIGRLKLIDSASIGSIIQNIKEYFEPKSKDNSLAEPAQETVSLSQ